MTGTRAISGSLLTRFRKRVIVASESSIPSSTLMSMNVCSVRDLLARNCDCGLEIAGQNQFRKLWRTGDIRALADDNESKVARDVEWLEPGKLEGLDLVNFIGSSGTFGCFRLRRRPLLRPRIS